MTGDPAFRRSRTLRRLLLLALAICAFAVIHLRSQAERTKAQEVCGDGVEVFDSAVTGADVKCEAG